MDRQKLLFELKSNKTIDEKINLIIIFLENLDHFTSNIEEIIKEEDKTMRVVVQALNLDNKNVNLINERLTTFGNHLLVLKSDLDGLKIKMSHLTVFQENTINDLTELYSSHTILSKDLSEAYEIMDEIVDTFQKQKL